MPNPLLSSFSLVDINGSLIIAAILLLLVVAIVVNVVVRTNYRRLSKDLQQSGDEQRLFRAPVLNKLVGQAIAVERSGAREVNTQAMIEHAFQSDLGWLLIGERLVKASGGLLIILGLVGTFYGLTRSIGKLVELVSGDFNGAAEVTESLVHGLTDALSGMSVAFTTSLVGIVAAIIMTLLGVFANVSERRQALMLELETFLDQLIERSAGSRGAAPGTNARGATEPEHLPAALSQSVTALETSVVRFEAALNQFADTTRDFREFNLHLKDNVQRLSLCFADLGDTLKEHTRELGRHSPPRGPR